MVFLQMNEWLSINDVMHVLNSVSNSCDPLNGLFSDPF